jgi:predicted O-methyltransferase YrrM
MHVTITTVKQPAEGSWLIDRFPEGKMAVQTFARHSRIEELATKAQAAGPLPLWNGYRGAYAGTKRAKSGAFRSSDDVRTRQSTGLLYYHLVRELRPSVVVEIGTAFGVSGMYWVAGLEDNNVGHLTTFEPNETWRAIAVRNLSAIGSRFTSVSGTFEDLYRETLPMDAEIDFAFIDGIHTSAFVYPQVSLLKERMRHGSLLILDDIRFSKDMFKCWSHLARAEGTQASIEVGSRTGIIEYAGSK